MGVMKLKTPGLSFFGFFIIMLMPMYMKGIEKSIAISRAELIDKGATAKSNNTYTK